MSADPLRVAMVTAVTQTLETMAFLQAQATTAKFDGASTASLSTVWSWVKVIEPCPGMVAMSFQASLATEIAQTLVGGAGTLDPTLVADTQAEITNVITGRLIHRFFGEEITLSLGIPRTGRGAPNVHEPGWVGQVFEVGKRYLVIYVHGHGLTSATLSRPPSTAPHSVTARADEATRALEQLPDEEGPLTTIGNFTIIGPLGEGGMGMVYKAHHSTLQREVALKVLRPEYARNEQFAKRFLREARVAAQIEHPHVVSVFDAGIERGHLYIAMRFVAGGDLAGLLNTCKTMPENEALTMIGQCLMGLQAISDHGMIHRDIKPANIFLDLDRSPRLGDLGLARIVAQDDGLSQAGSTQGTPSYMSPEQARGARDIDIRSDIYSLGATLYTMVVGHPPFSGTTIYDTVAQVLYAQPTPPREVNPAVSAEVDAMIMRAMAKKAEDRFQTPNLFIDAIDDLLTSRESRARGQASGQPSGEAAPGSRNWMKRLFRLRGVR